jgi:hypothetical protein
VSWLVLRPRTSPQAAPRPSAPTASAAATAAPARLPGAPSAATTTASRSPAASPSGTERPRPALPDGWRDYRDSTGFSVYVPEGWTRSREGSIVYFRDLRAGRVLGIDQSDRPRSNPVADWRGQASYRVARGDFPGYREIHIRAVSYWLKAADWEFTFAGRSGRRHVNNRGFVVSKTQAYGIYWQTSDAGWRAARADLQLVFDSFRPAKNRTR